MATDTEGVVRRVRVHSISLARAQPPLFITITYQTVDLEHAFNGTLILSKEEMDESDFGVGDMLEIHFAKT